MINKKDFTEMQKDVLAHDAFREKLIRKSRDVVHISKQIIYAVHRLDMKNASKYVVDIKKSIADLRKIAGENIKLLNSGSYKVAMQEFVEAMCYFEIVKNKKLPTHKNLRVETDHYLLGLCDLTGELVRRAIQAATKDDFKTPIVLKDFVDQLFGEFLRFDFRNNELRKKFDGMKYDLKKLEDLVYNLKINNKI